MFGIDGHEDDAGGEAGSGRRESKSEADKSEKSEQTALHSLSDRTK